MSKCYSFRSSKQKTKLCQNVIHLGALGLSGGQRGEGKNMRAKMVRKTLIPTVL
jgi:hypothetical protein